MYGAFAVGGMVTMGPPAVVEEEDVDVVVVETDEVVVVLSVDVEVCNDDVVVVVSMLVVLIEEEEVVLVVLIALVLVVLVVLIVLVVLSDVEVEDGVVEAVVSVTLGVVEGSPVVWAAVSGVATPAGSADTRAVTARTRNERSTEDGWAFPSPFGRSGMVPRP